MIKTETIIEKRFLAIFKFLFMKRSALVILGLLALCATTKAQDEKFKALFMFNFTKYIEWPQAKQSGDFVIGVIGNSAIVGELNTIASKKTVGAQAIKVKQISSADDVTKLHIVYVTEDKSGEAAALAEKIKGKGVVLITDKAGFAKSTSGINYCKKDGKPNFEVSTKHLEEEGVKVSSQLLALGQPVD